MRSDAFYRLNDAGRAALVAHGVRTVIDMRAAREVSAKARYSLLLVLVSLSFWFVRVENLLTIFWAFADAGRFPVDVYPGWLRFTLSTVVPVGIAVTAPSRAISGKIDPLGVALVAAGTCAAYLVASAFWRLGLRSYTGASA